MNIWFLNTLGSGTDFINIISQNLDVKGVIGLSKREATDSISDYIYQKDICDKMGLMFVEIDSYALTKDSDKEKVLNIEIDVLVVCGWQRLIPQWLINHCNVCAIGSHGSPFGITGGRGRSPQNWSLILGLKQFYISIFKISAGIDDGDVIDTKIFEYSDFDDIQSSYFKVVLLTSHMVIEAIKDKKLTTNSNHQQSSTDAEYFPQRFPDDGFIDWNFPTIEIHRMIRALTDPYPGAKSNTENAEVIFIEAIPFESIAVFKNSKPGQIVFIFHNQQFLVKTGDSYLLVKKFTTSSSLKVNDVFRSIDGAAQISQIISRHEDKYPDLKIVSALIDYRNKITKS